jgi:hypothetical protein
MEESPQQVMSLILGTKQTSVAFLSIEAEYKALVGATCEAM